MQRIGFTLLILFAIVDPACGPQRGRLTLRPIREVGRSSEQEANGRIVWPLCRAVVIDTLYAPRSLLEGYMFKMDLTSEKVEAFGDQIQPVMPERLEGLDLQRALGRLPELNSPPAPLRTFARREEGMHLPETVPIREDLFSSPAARPEEVAIESEQLRLVRYAPHGDVDISAQLTATFSQPVIPIARALQGRAIPCPVRLVPEPPGTWRWLNAQTILFESDDRFPMATEYTASIAPDTRAISGGELTGPARWTFRTPPPSLNTFWPRRHDLNLEPMFFLEFDQQIEPTAVLAHLSLQGGDREWRLRLATEEEIAEQELLSELRARAIHGTSLIVRAEDKLPTATAFRFLAGPGIPSAEGPLTSSVTDTFYVQTYQQLRFLSCGCWKRNECRPGGPWRFEFNNRLDESLEKHPELVTIEPPIGDMTLDVRGSLLSIRGASEALTTYVITLDERIRDCFGQSLGDSVRIVLTTQLPSMRVGLGMRGFVILDPTGPARLPIYSEGCPRLRVTYYKVTPEDYALYRNFGRQGDRWRAEPMEPRVIDIADGGRKHCEILLDLEEPLAEAGGMLVAVVEADVPDLPALWAVRSAWIQRTPIGISAHADGTRMRLWATDLGTGEPLEGVSLSVHRDRTHAVTDAAGMAELPMPVGKMRNSLLVARQGDQVAIFPNMHIGRYRAPRERLLWHILDDRKLYQPGETVHIKGWIRSLTPGPRGDLRNCVADLESITCSVADRWRNEFFADTLHVDAYGGFHFEFELPRSVSCGRGRITLKALTSKELKGKERSHWFHIEEFRRPEFEVATRASGASILVDTKVRLSAEARFFSGGGVSDAEVIWTLQSRPGHFRPVGWEHFSFGLTSPRWFPYGSKAAEQDHLRTKEIFKGTTDQAGTHGVRIGVGASPPIPMSISAEASVMDHNRQAWTSRTQVLFHPSSAYVGLRTNVNFLQAGETLGLEAVVADLDGKPLPGRKIELAAEHLTRKRVEGKWQTRIDRRLTWSLTSADSIVGCGVPLTEPGAWILTARVDDERGRVSVTQVRRWVAGDTYVQPHEKLQQEKITFIPDKDEWAPGETAQLLLQVPFYPAEGLVSLRRQGFEEVRRFRLDRQSYTLSIPIREEYTPGIAVSIDLVGTTDRVDELGEVIHDLPRRPACARGVYYLCVPPHSRRLMVEIVPERTRLTPGQAVPVVVGVRDPVGRPVCGAQVLLMVVDEAILGMARYDLQDPMEAFYRRREHGIADGYMHRHVRLASRADFERRVPPDESGLGQEFHFRGGRATEVAYAVSGRDVSEALNLQAGLSKCTMGSSTRGLEELKPTALRSDFDPLAHFAPALRTGKDGRVIDTVRVPDNLTRYRLMAVALDEEKSFGHGASGLTTELPLMVRPSLPRFLNVGDQAQLPVVVHNESDTTLVVDVVARTRNLRLLDSAGQRLLIPPRSRAAVHFPAQPILPGTAGLLVGALSQGLSDAVYREFPVWTPATTEACAAYGIVDSGAVAHAVAFPAGAFAEFGELQVTTASTAMHELSDAIKDLSECPYASSEAIASRLLGLIAVRDVACAFDDRISAEDSEFKRFVEKSLAELRNRRTTDHGFASWRRDQDADAFLTVHVMHALVRAHQAGFEEAENMILRSFRYLNEIDEHIPAYRSSCTRRSIQAYALYVRNLYGLRVRPAEVERIIDSASGAGKLSLEVLGWLLPLLKRDAPVGTTTREELLRLLNARVMETAAHAEFTTIEDDEDYLIYRSRPRTDALLLVSLLDAAPESALIVKLVRGLLAVRRDGHWSGSQENAWVLLGIGTYFRTHEARSPRFKVHTWFSDEYYTEQRFAGHSLERQRLELPMRALAAFPQPEPLVLSKEGAGRLYYRIGLRYALRDPQQPSVNQGFQVSRTYAAVDDSNDVRRDEQGIWHIRAGARVRVRLTMEATGRRFHVALVDPLPAGFEPVNLRLLGTGRIPRENDKQAIYRRQRRPWFLRRSWYEHQNLRDDRVEAFARRLTPGVYEYTYVARATTPGRFIAPPCKAEEMYHPETFGRSESHLVMVES